MKMWRFQGRKRVKGTGPRAAVSLSGFAVILCLLAPPAYSKSVQGDAQWTGDRIMTEVFKRHEMFPYVFEEQSIILMDEAGNRDVRKVRRFSRVEKDGTINYLLVFDNPSEVRGVALMTTIQPSGQGEGKIYLPAFGKGFKSQSRRSRDSLFLGTDFSIGDLTPEVLSGFRYVRVADKKIDKSAHFVVEAFPVDREIERTKGYSLQRRFIRKDIFFIVRTDYYDLRGRLFKSQTFHDLKRVDGDMWRPNMILMENYKMRHKTLIKIDRRVFSHDYVPPEMFTPAWIMEHRHVLTSEKFIPGEAFRASGETEDALPVGPRNQAGQDR